MNIVFWPVNPLRIYRSLLGRMIRKNFNAESDDESDDEENDEDSDENDLLVIGHHDV